MQTLPSPCRSPLLQSPPVAMCDSSDPSGSSDCDCDCDSSRNLRCSAPRGGAVPRVAGVPAICRKHSKVP